MLTEKQLELFKIFKDNIFNRLTFKQIKNRQKSNNFVQTAIKKFLNLKLINSEKIGNVITYSINLDNELTITFLSLIDQLKFMSNDALPKKTINKIQKKLIKQTPFFILIIFGSYAKRTANNESDLDIAVIVETEAMGKRITPSLESVKRRELIEIDYHIFTAEEFIGMLTAEQENVGKEIYRHSIIPYGSSNYYNLIKGLKNEKFV